jgi:DNA-binding transcriptional LysR family regulator
MRRSSIFTRLSLRHLSLIASISDVGSLKQAAERIGMSQPRATKALQEAEDIAGHKLFHRSNRGLRATVAGDAAIRHARNVLAQIRSMEREFRGLATGAGFRLRVGTIMGAVPYVTETVRRFIETFPEASVEIQEDTSARLLTQLDRSALDVVVGRHRVSVTPELYKAVPFHDEVLRVVTSPDNPLSARPRVTLDELSDLRWIVYTESMPMRISLEREFEMAGLPFPSTLIETQSALTTISLMRQNRNTVALLSGDVAGFFADAGMAVPLALHLRSKSEPYEAITRKSRDMTEHVQAFISELLAGTKRRVL